MDTDTILRNFGRRVVCTQQVCTRFAPRLGISRAQALGMGAAFGSGMGHAETCGCVTGALLVLGLQFGPQNTSRGLGDVYKRQLQGNPGRGHLPPGGHGRCNAKGPVRRGLRSHGGRDL